MARKRKDRNEIAEALIQKSRNASSNTGEEEEEVFNDNEEEEEEAVKGFFACYLLCSLSPRFKGHTYIGFTVNPRRRIRQHNGEITSGAWRTKRKRPWEMVLCVYGFPTNVSALQFEWAWQHPTESLAVRKAAATLKSLSGIANKIKLVYLMLTLPPWQSLKLTVNFFSTKYTTHSVGCPNLPKQMKVKVDPIDELPCYIEVDQLSDDNDEDVHFEGDRNDNGEKQLFFHADSPVKIPVSRTMRLGGTATAIEDANSVLFSEELQAATSTATKFDQDGPLLENHTFTSKFGFKLQNGKEDNGAQFSSIDTLVQAPCDSITSFIDTVEMEKCRNSLWLFEDTSNLRKQMKHKLTTMRSATVEERSQIMTGCTYFSSETGSTLQHGESFITREDHRETFDITDSPPSSSYLTMPNQVTTLEDKIPCRLFQGNNCKTGRARAQLKATKLKDDNDEQPLSSNSLLAPGVEVIDILTSSPECTLTPFRRKKRASLVNRQEVIDLTDSPGCIQL